MGRRNHKSIICFLLAGFWIGLSCLWVSGCSDNPDAKAAKEVRNQTAEAVQMSLKEKNYEGYDAAHDKVMASLERNRPQGLTKDAALLASGNLALVKGQQMQAGLSPKTLQLRTSTNKLEKILRSSEKLLIEKERSGMLLAAEDQEIVELQKLLNGDDQTEGLNKQLEQVGAQREKLLSQKTSMQADRERIQAVLDEHQGNADTLMRQAELAKGAARLDLEKQAFAILQQRKDHYIKAQTLENEMAVLDGKIALVQVRFDGLTQNIQEIQQRIEVIDTSPTRTALKQQMRETEEAVSGNQQRLAGVSDEIATAFAAYRKASDEICAVYEEAFAEFEKIRSEDAKFAATVRLADSAHHVALACSMSIRVQKDLSERLQGLLDTTDPVFVSAMQSLPIQHDIDADYKKKAFAYFDRSIETNEKALLMTARLSRNLEQEGKSKIQEAECSLLKSKLLALYGKMQLADLTGEFDIANSTETAMDDLIQRGSELGVCFTQSETMRVITNEGLNYLPSLPLNMEVFIEGKKQELSAWKRLPVSEQEPVVESNIQEIDRLVAQYGQDAAQQLEPLKQEMLAAQERGFKEPTPTSSSGSDPNSFSRSPDDPNLLW